MNFINLLGIGRHVFAVYPNKEIEIDNCFLFLKCGLENNELTIIVIEEESRATLFKKLSNEFNIDDPASIENSDDVIILTPSQGHYTHFCAFSGEKFLRERERVVSYARLRNKTGLRMFIETDEYISQTS